jgi:hypothetical protein
MTNVVQSCFQRSTNGEVTVANVANVSSVQHDRQDPSSAIMRELCLEFERPSSQLFPHQTISAAASPRLQGLMATHAAFPLKRHGYTDDPSQSSVRQEPAVYPP